MNIEIANRLVNLRKEKGLSQEQLAEKIGVSRQAVSKWERSEASPDTDNLIMLARLYEISLDELLRTEDEIPMPEIPESVAEPVPEPAPEPEPEEAGEKAETQQEAEASAQKEDKEDKVHIGWDGIHVSSKDGDEVHIGSGGIHVREQGGDEVHVGRDGVSVNENGHIEFGDWDYWKNKAKKSAAVSFPIVMLGVIAFIGFGCSSVYGWKASWIFLAFIPIVLSAITAVRKGDPRKFAYPVLAVVLWLYPLCINGMPYYVSMYSWTVLLTIPLYYWFCRVIKPIGDTDAPKGLRGFLKRHSIRVSDLLVFAAGIILAFMFGMNTFGNNGVIALILLAVPIVQSFFRAILDRDAGKFSFELVFAWIYTAVAVLDNWSIDYGFSHFVLLGIPLCGWIRDKLRASRAAEERENSGNGGEVSE